MLPAFLLTVMTPSATVQPAGDLSRVDTHSSRFLPSKRTMASDGAAPGVAAGVTTLGSGFHTSVSSGLGLPGACCASTKAPDVSAASGRRSIHE